MEELKIKRLTAKEAVIISDNSTDIIELINEEIYQACISGYGGVSIDKEKVKDFYSLNKFLDKYFTEMGFNYNQGNQFETFFIYWDTKKDTKRNV